MLLGQKWMASASCVPAEARDREERWLAEGMWTRGLLALVPGSLGLGDEGITKGCPCFPMGAACHAHSPSQVQTSKKTWIDGSPGRKGL